MIRFRKIEIEGFGSIISKLTYQLDNKGLNCIIGPNGAGKTSIFSALCWALYGSTLKGKAEPWKEIRPQNWQGTRVSITFERDGIEYQVINCQDYKGVIEGAAGKNKMFLYVNGKYQTHYRDKPDVKEEVKRILGMTIDLFKNSILFGQKLKRIIQETGPDKKKIFEEAFEASFINDAKALAEAKLGDLKNQEYDLLNSIEKWEGRIENIRELIKAEESREEETAKQVEIIKSAQSKLGIKYTPDLIDRTKEIIINLKAKIEKADELKDKKFKLELSLGKYETEVKMGKSSLTEILNELQRIPLACRVCGSKLDEKKIKKTKETIRIRYNNKKQEIEKAKIKEVELQNEVNSIDIKLAKYKDTSDNLRKAEKRLEAAKIYQTYQKQIKDLKDRAKTVSETSNLDFLKGRLAKFKKELEEHQNQLKKITKRVEVYNWLIQKPLSNAGIKSYIFNELLNSVNSRLNYYTSYIGFKVEFGIDLKSARKDFYTVCYKDETLVDYKELSGGQQQLVDIVIAFSIHDVVNENHKVQLLIMDEVFESLDEANIELVSDLINLKAKDKPVYLITHRKEFSTAMAKVLELKLNKAGHTIARK
jgi:DNA repair exonuclease SbcCD ATPase subunit